jgi:hypothetical protein
MQCPNPIVCGVMMSLCANLMAVITLAGCSAKSSAPPAMAPSEMDAIKRSLAPLGARVTSDSADGLYVTLRNTFVEIHETGGIVEGSNKTQQGYKDFASVNDAVAKVFLAADELEPFKKWLRTSLSSTPNAPQQAEYKRLKLTLSRNPLHMVFSFNQPAE